MSQASDRIYVSPGEAWAIEPSRLLGGPEAYFFLFGPAIKETERIGDVAVVYLNGPLDHHAGEGCGDSYEALLDRFDTAVDGGEAGPPKAVVIKVDSPGGKVSGLNATCARIKSTARAGDQALFISKRDGGERGICPVVRVRRDHSARQRNRRKYRRNLYARGRHEDGPSGRGTVRVHHVRPAQNGWTSACRDQCGGNSGQ